MKEVSYIHIQFVIVHSEIEGKVVMMSNPKIEVFKVLAKIKKCRDLINKVPSQYSKNIEDDLKQASKDIQSIKEQLNKPKKPS